MQPLHDAVHSPQSSSAARGGASVPAGEPFADHADKSFASRWEPQVLVSRAPARDPYTDWLAQRAAARPPAAAATGRGSRFGRRRGRKAAWEVIAVTLTGEID